jgi:molybdenum cofactor cytidylyltransferase
VTAGILLAAGLSRRMGRAKLLLPLEGRPVVRHAAEGLLAAGIDPLTAVVGPDGEAVAAALADLPVRIVVNPHPEAGQASSLVAGIAALPSATEAVLVALGDQPFVPAEVIRELIYALQAADKVIAAPRYTDGLGNPVLFRAAVFAELLALGGDRGARAVVERDPGRVALIELDRPMPEDVDTPDDYARLRSREEPV